MAKPHWTHLIVHHTVTGPDATVADIDALHAARGFRYTAPGGRGGHVGYHYLIQRDKAGKGYLKAARPDTIAGAHAPGYNTRGIGLSVIGTFHPGYAASERLTPDDQLYADILGAVVHLCRKYGIPAKNVLGHCDTKATACPGDWFPLAALKRDVAAALGGA
jgi:N-acetyl-anhydromuramyl-L-alanine amidase AmpD